MEPDENDGRQSLRRSQVDEICIVDGPEYDDISEFEGESSASSSSSPSSSAAKQNSVLEDSHSWDQLAEALGDNDGEDLPEVNATPTEFRAPIVCVMGHVDTGKTTLLDKLRKTSIQKSEAGGITQQMGATFFPKDILVEKVAAVNHPDLHIQIQVPGLLILDTPGHASFGAMRNRGTTICDIAILVIDIMHGIENTTREAIDLLKKHKVPFIIALNKVDRLFEWKSTPDAPILSQLKQQTEQTMDEYEKRWAQIKEELRTIGIPAMPYYKTPDFKKFVSAVPISAVTGEGICDLFFLLMLLSQKFLFERLKPKNEFQCTVLEVRPTEGFGVTMSVILINGTISIGSTIVAAGLRGPIVGKVRALIVPPSLSEIRDTSKKFSYSGYVKKVSGAMAVKIAGRGFDAVVPGSPLIVPGSRQNIEVVKAMVMADIEDISRLVVTGGGGVCVNASTLGSLEALAEFLTTNGVPIQNIELGNVSATQIWKASNATIRAYKCILAFDVGVPKHSLQWAEQSDVVIISANIIYNLMDKWREYSSREKIKFSPKTPFRLIPVPDAPIFDKPLSVSCVVEGTIYTGATVSLTSGWHVGTVVAMRRYEDGVPVGRARDGDVITFEFDATVLFLDAHHDVLIPAELMIQNVYDSELQTNLWKAVVPEMWHRLIKTDPFVPKLLSFVQGTCTRLNDEIRSNFNR